MKAVDSRTFWRWMLALGCAAMLLRIANIAYLLHCSARDGIEYYAGADTASNIRNAEALFNARPLAPIFRERITYPFLLAAVKAAGLEYRDLLWLAAPLEIPTVLALALLGLLLTRRQAVAALGAVLYILNPNAFQLSATLMPDWLNGQVMLMGIAALLHWAQRGLRKSALAAGGLLLISQTIRPTLFLIIGPLVLLLWKGFWARERRWGNLLLCAAVLAYPAFNLGLNARLYGVPNLLLSSGFQLQHCYVSYVRALERNAAQPGSIAQMYFEEKHRVISSDPREVATDPYGNNPIHPDFARNYNGLVAESKAYLVARPGLWLQAGYDSVYRQLFYMPRLAPDARNHGLYPVPSAWLYRLHNPALFFAFCGVFLLIRRLPWGTTLFFAGCTAIAVLGATASWYDTVRVRLLVDLLYAPVIAVGLLSLPAWLCLGGLVAAAYVPRRLFRLSVAYMQVASTIVLVLAAAFLLRISGPKPENGGPPA